MASVAGASLILILLIDGAQLRVELKPKRTREPETKLLFGKQGGEVSFRFMSAKRHQSNFVAVLLLSTINGYLFVKNTSDASQVVNAFLGSRSLAFTLKNLSFSDSGDYLIKRWNRGVLKEERKYSLTVCKNQCAITLEKRLSPIVLKTNEIGDRLQLYEECFNFTRFPHLVQTTLVLDSKLPPDIVPKRSDQRGAVEMTNNSTTVRVSTKGLTNVEHYVVIWSGYQCCFSHYWVNIFAVGTTPVLTIRLTDILLKQGDRLTLPCHRFTEHVEEIIWKTPVNDLYVDVSHNVSRNVSHPEEEEMYVETRNYSLVIPSVEGKHTGTYRCEVDYDAVEDLDLVYQVLVCSDLGATHVPFSLGGAVDLVCGAELNGSDAEGTFYHQEQELYSTIFHSQFSLTMSNLTQNDSGLYLCRIRGYSEKWKRFCYERKIYLFHKHPFGIDSTFYRVYSSLMACGLLGMICAVISVHLRVRGRDQISQQRLRRTAEPSGRPPREEE